MINSKSAESNWNNTNSFFKNFLIRQPFLLLPPQTTSTHSRSNNDFWLLHSIFFSTCNQKNNEQIRAPGVSSSILFIYCVILQIIHNTYMKYTRSYTILSIPCTLAMHSTPFTRVQFSTLRLVSGQPYLNTRMSRHI